MKNNIGYALGNEKGELRYKEDTALLSNTTGVGVEIEIENCQYEGLRENPYSPNNYNFLHHGNNEDLPRLRGFWKVVKDGSLRNGTEFVFDGPLEGANITLALIKLSEFFKIYRNLSNREGVVVSDRCSVHVHLDVRDLSDKELTNLLLVYILFERIMFLAIDPSRVKNNYCRPLTDSSFKYSLNELLSISNSEDRLIRILQSISSHGDKYSALNILPVTSKGSVEFRHHQGTTEPLELINWINIIFAIKNISIKFDIIDLINRYDKGEVIELVQEVFAGTSLGSLKTQQTGDIYLLMRAGSNDVKEIIHMGALSKNGTGIKSRVRPVNTLLYQFKLKNNLIAEGVE